MAPLWKCLGVTTEEAARAKGVAFRKELEWERAGMLPPQSARDARLRELREHLEDYLRDKAVKRKDEKYISNCRVHILRVVRECRWKFLEDVSADAFVDWRSRQKLSGKTLNDYLADLRTFFGWLGKMKRVFSNPFEFVEKIDTRRLRHGPQIPETITRHKTGNRRCRWFVRNVIQYGPHTFTE